jgi:starch synthase (maltosyl-transferring)
MDRPRLPPDAQSRVVIEEVRPRVDDGRFPIKRVPRDEVVVEADAFADGHDVVTSVLRWRTRGDAWNECEMEPIANDRWRAAFVVHDIGRAEYSVAAWIDEFRTWRRDLQKKVDAGQDVSVDVLTGAELVEHAARRATGGDADRLRTWAERLSEVEPNVVAALSDELAELMTRYPDRTLETTSDSYDVVVDPPDARFSAWYEFFPRSTGRAGEHGTFKDAIARLPYVAEMAFDIVYLPPVHPIGVTKRKGRNNSPDDQPGDVGSPWAIGAEEGGHTAIHPDLGSLEDFDRFVDAARSMGLEVAMDLAYQCSPDHPWVKEHPEWFRHRVDGTIRYAENPPKKYEDIYPIDFGSADREALWEELRRVVEFWISRGIRVFRVDNPHTKPFAFWEWLIGGVKERRPDVIFLSEAFTRPKVMGRLAKLGFTQSYTYFTWRNTKWELQEYFTELTKSQCVEFFRPNVWPNTPDILPEYLQWSGRPGFVARLVLAATLGASYGIYGPAFELCEDRPIAPGREEYLDSEKYELKDWDLDDPRSLAELIARVNLIRRSNEALHTDRTLEFLEVQNDQLVAYCKRSADDTNVILVVVNLDPHHVQSGMLHVPPDVIGVDATQPYQVHDLLTDARYLWHGDWNYVELNPHSVPAHIFRVRRRISHEQDFDYYA